MHCGDTVGIGLAVPHLQGGAQENLTSWDFASRKDVASQWKTSKAKEASKPGLKISGI